MKLYETATQEFRVDGDFSNTEVIMSFRQGRISLNKKPVRLEYSGVYTKIYTSFSQNETADFDPTKAVYVQANFIWPSGARKTSDVVKLRIGQNLLDREVAYE